MRKEYYLPAVASLLIIALMLSLVLPVIALPNNRTLRARALPVLEVKTIPEDDEVRKTGVIVLGLTPKEGWPKPYSAGEDKLSQHKILVTYNGVPVTPRWLYCEVIQKEKVHPMKYPQFTQENVLTMLSDVSDKWKCKVRWAKPGVGVLDVYFVGKQTKEWIADHMLVVVAELKVGSTWIYGSDVQDKCVLGWLTSTNHRAITKPDGSKHHTWDDPLGPFVSCEEAALWQRYYLGLGIQGWPWG